MLFASIASPESLAHIPVGVDGLELRLDLYPHVISHHLPVIFTVRREGFKGSEEAREARIRSLFTLKPNFFDLEYDMRPEFLEWAFGQGIPIILSYHNFEQTPVDLMSIYQAMRKYPAYTYKIATLANSASDALRLLLFAKENQKISAISMGEKGSFGRVLGPIVGNLINYAHTHNSVALGQLSAEELMQIYRYSTLDTKTALFGLIGDPIATSCGHFYHNQEFAQNHCNAVYVKMNVAKEELQEFLQLAKEIGFRGLSVTMPLKESAVFKFGPVNTVLLDNELTGFNSDGTAALDAIGNVENKKIVLLGAGGAAYAVAFEAKKRGAEVTILNRTIEKGAALAKKLGCKFGALNEVPSEYDILINCTPSSMPIDPSAILASALVMDLVYVPQETPFLKEAAQRGSRIITGELMFQNQAKTQSEIWRSLC